MRIDYSDPKRSCNSSGISQNRPRKESSGGIIITAFISSIICLGIGFGSGWMLSQRSAKKAFKAAMEQISIENSPQVAPNNAAAGSPPNPAAALPSPQNEAAAQSPVQAAADSQLSFYKTLPSGQKNNSLGSGINPKEENSGKQPLQAVMPSNISRVATPQLEESSQKNPVQPTTVKSPPIQETAFFTVQVASCSTKGEAENYRGKMVAKGYSVNVVEFKQADKTVWYRVHVGKRLDKDTARELAKKLGKGAIAVPDNG
ncbi:MAG: SPOR domain-containing protein [Desulfuromonadaceae bacterium]|nr:SPOR domain-containing protein [Desulfuromonadaceae bacterium]MDD2854940.1 SPOR domain-containing protein [Desulfuromonadaceae bacterium]